MNAARGTARGTTWTSVKHGTRRALRRAEARLDPALDLVDPGRKRYFPRHPDDTDGYLDRFPATARVFEPFVRRGRDAALLPATADGRVAIVVMPWFGTACPWYAIALGLGLARRGRPVTFVWHDLPLPIPALELQNAEIGRVLGELGAPFEVVRVSDLAAAAGAGAADDALVDDLTAQNLVWTQRAAQDLDAAGERHRAAVHESLRAALPQVRSFCERGDLRCVVVPGGVLLASGLYLALADEAGVRGATFDSGIGWMVVGTRGVAAQQTDLTRAFASLEAEPEARKARLRQEARDEFERRRSGADAMQYQHAPSGAPPVADQILIPLSVHYDTAALGRHHLFDDAREWLVETIAALLRDTDDPIVVRQHPSERRPAERSRFDAGTIVGDAFGSNPQVRFIAAEEPENTYDLLDGSRLVLPFVSTIGIEAAAVGTPVIVGGDVYYRDLGFVWSPSTRAEYAEVLRQGARGELAVTPAQQERAWLCYYLNAVCQRTFTNFSVQPGDYWRWVARQPDDVFAEPAVIDVLTALDEDVPLALLRHQRRA